MKIILNYWLNENQPAQVIEVTSAKEVLNILKVISKTKVKVLSKKEQSFYDKLPATFKRSVAVDTAIECGLSKSFFETSMRKDYFKKMFLLHDYGVYKKTGGNRL